MNILFLLIPISLVVMGIAVWLFLWAVRSGQFEDLEGPGHRILMDDDDPLIPPPPGSKDRRSAKTKNGP
ncbi:MAG TPA: cbb3-type cytochrome oxidase assembly protein CcoS [Gammaproteobacteria bacterium]|nr:cbb3-type cytochrome oxidase assembly protein CcoS [Gammaproteobacteria bacterium]